MCFSHLVSFCNYVVWYNFQLFRFLILAVSHLPYFLTTSTTTCALLTKRCSAHLHTLRFLLPTKSTSTWESQKPSSSVPQVPKFISRINCTFRKNMLHYISYIIILFVLFPSNPEYCGTFCYPSVSQSPYLHTVGEKLLPSIDILWTGEFEATPYISWYNY